MDRGITSEEIEVKQAFDKMAKDIRDEKFYMSWIDNLDIDVKWKNTLKDLLGVMGKIGGIIYSVGKFVINVLMKTTECIVKNYPNASKGVIIGIAIGILTYFIPVVGPVIAPYVAGILGFLGGLNGTVRDLSFNCMRNEIFTSINAQFGLGK